MKPARIPYEALALTVERMYLKEFPEGTPPEVIEQHCDLIRETIEGCGWTAEEYLNKWYDDKIKHKKVKKDESQN